MKFQPDRAEGVNVVTRHTPDQIWIGPTAYGHSLVVPWQGEPQRWDVADPAALTAEHFARLLAFKPQLVIFGSGARQQFVRAALQRPLIDAGVGIETMDTAAACRTYNVLATEGRCVVGAFIVGADAPPGL